MKFLIVAVMISVALGGSVLAEFDEGLVAAMSGDYVTAYREFHPLAGKGDAEAQHNLGVMYYNGHGVAKNFGEAAKWFRKAAEQGIAEAQSSLGIMYHKGEGVALDHAQSVIWYRLAADQGFAWAQYSLGAAYAGGEGVALNMEEAVKWYRKAAAQGLDVPAWAAQPLVSAKALAGGTETQTKTTTPSPANAVPAGVSPQNERPLSYAPEPSPPPLKAQRKTASAWRIQLGALASAKTAKKEWQRLSKANEDLLTKLTLNVLRADLGAKGVFYRVQAGPLTSKSEARDLCTALKERKERCFIVPAK